MTYNRDLQEDKRGLWASLDTVEAVVKIIAELLSKVDVDGALALAGLEKGYSLATDVAEYLVMKGVPFREAHAKVGKLVGWCIAEGLAFADLTIEQWKEHIPEADPAMMGILSARESVNRRNVYGGTGFAQVKRQIEEAKSRL